MNTAQRRQALNDVFDRHEEMSMLLSCLNRSPALWSEDDPEHEIIQDNLAAKGFLRIDGGFWVTTDEGREALVAYINGDDVFEEFEGDLDDYNPSVNEEV